MAYLNVKSSFSFLTSTIRIEQYVLFAKQNKLTELALADDNFHAVFDFYYQCQKQQIKPLIGLRLNLENDYLLIYAKSVEGLYQLFGISAIQSERQVTIEEINHAYPELYYVANQQILDLLSNVKNKVILQEKKIINHLLMSDLEYVETLLKIGEHPLPNIISFETALKHPINYDFTKNVDIKLPAHQVDIPAINNYDLDYNINYLKQLSLKGLTKRMGKLTHAYQTRLEMELNSIIKMGYVNYFLIVYDYVLFAKKQKILVGPGRGSAAGSLVAYALGITDIDPLKYNLIFERFLNPERISMPDIDLDFPYDERDRVIEYIVKKYGSEHVANIITYGTLQAKQAIRDVAKILNIDSYMINDILKDVDSHKTIKANLDNIKIKIKFNANRDLKKCLKIAMALEGLPRHTSIHAAGIVISKEPLINKIPLVKGINNTYLTGVSMEYLEPLGLLKMDILAIKNLTLINNVLKTLKLSFSDIELNDRATFDLFSKGLTEGIFQFEANGMRKFLKALKPNSFSDLVAATALYRPGPMDNIYEFAKRKNHEASIDYLDNKLINILEETYGIIIYQEQIMQIAVQVAGFSLAKADSLRKAMSKKDKMVLAGYMQSFIDGGLKLGYEQDFLEKLFSLILKFADYGFPKAHAVSYATISYKMGYLKTHYPQIFMANLLNINIGSELKINDYITECRNLNIGVLPPDINQSTDQFLIKDSMLVFPLSAIKMVGSASVKTIIEEREKGPFTSLIDFIIRCYGQAIKENTIIALIKAGAFDNFGYNKHTLINNLDAMINYASLVKDISLNLVAEPDIIKIDEYSEKELLNFEQSVFGFYLSGHPTAKYKGEHTTDLGNLGSFVGQTVKVIGIIKRIKTIKTKKGDNMSFITITDETGNVSLTIFPKVHEVIGTIPIDTLVEVIGNVELRNHELQIIVNNLVKLD